MNNETENRLLYLFIKNVIFCEISRFSEREMFKSKHQNEHNITYQLTSYSDYLNASKKAMSQSSNLQCIL